MEDPRAESRRPLARCASIWRAGHTRTRCRRLPRRREPPRAARCAQQRRSAARALPRPSGPHRRAIVIAYLVADELLKRWPRSPISSAMVPRAWHQEVCMPPAGAIWTGMAPFASTWSAQTAKLTKCSSASSLTRPAPLRGEAEQHDMAHACPTRAGLRPETDRAAAPGRAPAAPDRPLPTSAIPGEAGVCAQSIDAP